MLLSRELEVRRQQIASSECKHKPRAIGYPVNEINTISIVNNPKSSYPS